MGISKTACSIRNQIFGDWRPGNSRLFESAGLLQSI